MASRTEEWQRRRLGDLVKDLAVAASVASWIHELLELLKDALLAAAKAL